MTVEIEAWQLLTFLASAAGIAVSVAGFFVRQTQGHLDKRFTALEEARAADQEQLAKRFDTIERAHKEEANQWQRVERELLNMKAELPLHYVRREDYVQAVATIMAKLDAMSLRFENILLRGVKNHE